MGVRMLHGYCTICRSFLIAWILHNTGIMGRDYCPGDNLEAQCGQNEVVVIDEAKYGRMSTGRCINIVRDNIGCYGDAISIVDQWCSGKRYCNRRISDEDFSDFHDCPSELKGYLEASFTCVKVDVIPSQTCRISLEKQTSGNIMLPGGLPGSCGSTHTPLLIEARPGQTVNISTSDFSPREAGSHSTCTLRYGHMTDASNQRREALCHSSYRTNQQMLSNGNIVKVTINSNTINGFVLLHFEAKGCPELPSIKDAKMHRSGNTMVIECTEITRSWQMQCVQNQWQGTMSKCSEGKDLHAEFDTLESGSKINISKENVIIFVGTFILILSGVIVCVGIISLCVRICKTKKHKPPANQQPVSYGYTYDPRNQTLRMHTVPRHQHLPRTLPRQQPAHFQEPVHFQEEPAHFQDAAHFRDIPERTWSRLEMPDIVDQTLRSTTSQMSREEGIYENPGQPQLDSGSCIYSRVNDDDTDQDPCYSDSVKYYKQ